MNIGYIGMSHLGLVSSITCSKLGYSVICYDQNLNHIENLKKGIFNIKEPNLENIYLKNKKKILFSNNFDDLNRCEIVYLSLDIKTNNNASSDLSEVNTLINEILEKLNKRIILVVLCQVPPSFTRKIQWPKTKLYYQVETLIFGNAVERALYPERIIIGSEKKNYVNKKYLNFLNKFKCPLVLMNYESAELAKISINLFLISQVSTTNSISELANKINANWPDIKKSLTLDKRIGKYAYLNPGLGISGGNLERDLNSVIKLSTENQSNNSLFKTYKKLSDYNKSWVSKKLFSLIKKHKIKNIKVGILGITYKKNTHSIKNSPTIKLINDNTNINFTVYDPSMTKYVKKNVKIVENYKEVIKNSNILLIMNDWDEYRLIKIKDLRKLYYPQVVIDPFAIFLDLDLNKNKFVYESLQ